MVFRALCTAVLALTCGPVAAADLGRVPNAPPILFAPTSPIGVASEIPRSPLTDLVVDAPLRFAAPEQAQARCPGDRVVWVGFGSNFYRFDGKPTPDALGAFLCQGDASIEGDRPFRP